MKPNMFAKLRWRVPFDMLNLEGWFLMTRIDDDLVSALMISVKDGCDIFGQEIKTYDEECRFYGPIPEPE